MATPDLSLPTRRADAIAFQFDDAANIPQGRALLAHAAPIRRPDGSTAHWLTRVERLNTDTLPASQCLEFFQIPQLSVLTQDDKLLLEGPSAILWPIEDKRALFWPAVSNEFQARCYCGSLPGARALFDSIERALSSPSAMADELLYALDEIPMQAMLFEFEPEGLGMVHIVCRDWTQDGYQGLEAALRADPLSGLDALPWIYNSDGYHGTYDDYCSDNFVESTSPQLALAVWSRLFNPSLMRTRHTDRGYFASMAAILRSASEKEKLEESLATASSSRAALRV